MRKTPKLDNGNGHAVVMTEQERAQQFNMGLGILCRQYGVELEPYLIYEVFNVHTMQMKAAVRIKFVELAVPKEDLAAAPNGVEG